MARRRPKESEDRAFDVTTSPLNFLHSTTSDPFKWEFSRGFELFELVFVFFRLKLLSSHFLPDQSQWMRTYGGRRRARSPTSVSSAAEDQEFFAARGPASLVSKPTGASNGLVLTLLSFRHPPNWRKTQRVQKAPIPQTMIAKALHPPPPLQNHLPNAPSPLPHFTPPAPSSRRVCRSLHAPPQAPAPPPTRKAMALALR